MGPIIDVTAVRVVSDHVLEVSFETGEVKVVDVEPLMAGPVFDDLRRDYELFEEVRVDPEAGTVVWPNGADLSPRTLYNHGRESASRAR
jgi:hypothetical protein